MADKKKILLVDDEKDFCFITKKNLEEHGGFEVSVCNDSTRAIEKVRELRPDLILLDIVMPDKSGLDVAADLKNDRNLKEVPILFVTALLDEKEMEKRKAIIGKERYVSKPFNVKELIDTINEITSEVRTKEKRATVTFLYRNQIDFLDKLGKDASFHHGSKLSRGKILSEMVNLLMQSGIDIKEIDLAGEGLAKGILRAIRSKKS